MVPHAIYTLPCLKTTESWKRCVFLAIFSHWVRPLGYPCSMFVLEDGVLPIWQLWILRCLRIMGLWCHEAPKRRSEFQRMVDWCPGVLESYLIVTISVSQQNVKASKHPDPKPASGWSGLAISTLHRRIKFEDIENVVNPGCHQPTIFLGM